MFGPAADYDARMVGEPGGSIDRNGQRTGSDRDMRAARIRLGLIQIEVALAASISQSRTSLIENGHATPTQFLTPEEVAARLAVNVSYVYELARAKKLKSTKMGKYVRFDAAAVQAFQVHG